MQALLIANRGEIAVRIARAAASLGIRTVGVHGESDAGARHLHFVDEVRPLVGVGPTPYLDAAQLTEAASAAGADALHPGYGFLSEQAAFAEACAHAGLTWVGPSAVVLTTFGDKPAARALAASLDVPVLEGLPLLHASDAAGLLADGPIVLKAVAGGGGRGMRVVRSADQLEAEHMRAASEARLAFGDDRLFAERHLAGARHVEVQLVGDGLDVVVLGLRECTVQRRHQKLLEVAPPLALPDGLEQRLREHALALGAAVELTSLMTVEFLVVGECGWFIEANPRLQVEHTVTEE